MLNHGSGLDGEPGHLRALDGAAEFLQQQKRTTQAVLRGDNRGLETRGRRRTSTQSRISLSQTLFSVASLQKTTKLFCELEIRMRNWPVLEAALAGASATQTASRNMIPRVKQRLNRNSERTFGVKGGVNVDLAVQLILAHHETRIRKLRNDEPPKSAKRNTTQRPAHHVVEEDEFELLVRAAALLDERALADEDARRGQELGVRVELVLNPQDSAENEALVSERPASALRQNTVCVRRAYDSAFSRLRMYSFTCVATSAIWRAKHTRSNEKSVSRLPRSDQIEARCLVRGTRRRKTRQARTDLVESVVDFGHVRVVLARLAHQLLQQQLVPRHALDLR